MQDHLQAIITVLTLINPLMCAAIFARIEAGRPRSAQLADAAKAALAVLVILMLAALFGQRLLGVFGVSLDAFMVAGGGVLAWIGFGMLRGNSTNSQPSGDGAASENRSLTPLILFAASPGTITGVITLAVAQTRHELPVTALLAVFVRRAGDVARNRPGRLFRRPAARREWLCARHGHPFHGVDRDRDGSPVRPHGHPGIYENQRSVTVALRSSERLVITIYIRQQLDPIVLPNSGLPSPRYSAMPFGTRFGGRIEWVECEEFGRRRALRAI